MLDPYRSLDLYPGKCGVNSIILGFLFKFKPWFFDGKTVWWGEEYELRSEAEEEAFILREQISNSKI